MIKIDATSNKPLYEQIVDNIKSSYVKGYLKPGDEIFKTNKNMIFSAVMALRRAADWAIHFENGLKNKEEWNKSSKGSRGLPWWYNG